MIKGLCGMFVPKGGGGGRDVRAQGGGESQPPDLDHGGEDDHTIKPNKIWNKSTNVTPHEHLGDISPEYPV